MAKHQKPKKPCPSGGCVLVLRPELTTSGLTGDAKAIAIMLIVENRKPQESLYNASDAEESMRLMRQVLINRLKDKPSQYMAPGARTITDIIRGKGQFQGLGNYPKTDNTTYNSFEDVMDSKVVSVKNYVKMAINIATLDENSIKASIPEVIGWRTEDSGSPGNGFKADKTVAGNTFYIKDPDYVPPKAKPAKKKKSAPHANKNSPSKKHLTSKVTRKHKK